MAPRFVEDTGLNESERAQASEEVTQACARLAQNVLTGHFHEDAAQPAVRSLLTEIERLGLWQPYLTALGIDGMRMFNPVVYGRHDIVRALLATPEQHARAFLATIG